MQIAAFRKQVNTERSNGWESTLGNQ